MLLDANGNEFRMRGTNRTHPDVWSPAIAGTSCNCVRWNADVEPYIKWSPENWVNTMQSAHLGGTIADKMVQIVGFWDGTNDPSQATFDKMVQRWLDSISAFLPYQKYIIPNIANEWGNDPLQWAEAYEVAIPKLRAAGWKGAIMIDAPGSGQNGMAIAQYGEDILAADPLHNLIFSWHIYGAVYDSATGRARQYKEQVDLAPTMQALMDTGLCCCIGEFGPGRQVQFPTALIPPERVVALAENAGFGWMTWAWDDNDKAGGQGTNGGNSTDNGYSHLYDTAKGELGANLTQWGAAAVALWDKYGATKASVF